MEKEEMAKIARWEGSENGPLGKWPRARLEARPEAGNILQVDGKWYVAVAGVREENAKGNYGGLYARWVQVPANECEGW